MAFDRAAQPITQDTGKLAISCHRVLVNGSSVGAFNSAQFDLDGETRDISAGYPLRPIQQVLDSQSAMARVSLEELGGAAKGLLASIISSLNTSIVPTRSLELWVFRPVAEDIIITMTNAAMLQEFDLSFGNDFNALGLSFEQLVPAGNSLSDVLAFSTDGVVTNASGSPMLDTGDLAIGLPLVTVGGVSVGAIQAANLKLSTTYKRYESGYPKNLFKLTPLSHSVVLEIEAEEISSGLLAEDLPISLGAPASVQLSVALFDGTSITITLPQAVLSPSGGPNISQDDWATKSKRFTATGTTLLTIA
jgi:hypothetical protein